MYRYSKGARGLSV